MTPRSRNALYASKEAERDYGAAAGCGYLSELQRFDNAERVPRDIMRNGFEHALRFTNLDDQLLSLVVEL